MKSKTQKRIKGIKDLSKLLPKEEGKEILKLWEELHAARTNEAKLVRDLEIEMLLQALNTKIKQNKEFIAGIFRFNRKM